MNEKEKNKLYILFCITKTQERGRYTQEHTYTQKHTYICVILNPKWIQSDKSFIVTVGLESQVSAWKAVLGFTLLKKLRLKNKM